VKPVLRPASVMRWMGSLGIVLALGACATIMHGSGQSIDITSSPTGAKVFLDEQAQGMTPTVAKLARKQSHEVRLELEGYEPFKTTLSRKVSGWVWGNILFGGLIGLGVDAISGGLYKLTPEQLQAEMKKAGVSFRLEPDMMLITVTLHPQPGWEKVGQLEPDTTH